MPQRTVITVVTGDNLNLYGKEIRLARLCHCLSRKAVCDKMKGFGYAYYPTKLYRFEKQTVVSLPSREAMCLIDALNADFNLI